MQDCEAWDRAVKDQARLEQERDRIEGLKAELAKFKEALKKSHQHYMMRTEENKRLISLLMYSIGYGERHFSIESLEPPEGKLLHVDQTEEGWHAWVETTT